MSYSRWGDDRWSGKKRGSGKWYTYWSTSSGNVPDDQIFEICAVAWFTYKQLKEDLEACLTKVRSIDKATDKEIRELKTYIEKFLQDVENDQGLKEYLTVKQARKEDLALLMGALEHDKSRELLELRLREKDNE